MNSSLYHLYLDIARYNLKVIVLMLNDYIYLKMSLIKILKSGAFFKRYYISLSEVFVRFLINRKEYNFKIFIKIYQISLMTCFQMKVYFECRFCRMTTPWDWRTHGIFEWYLPHFWIFSQAEKQVKIKRCKWAPGISWMRQKF